MSFSSLNFVAHVIRQHLSLSQSNQASKKNANSIRLAARKVHDVLWLFKSSDWDEAVAKIILNASK